VRMLRKQFKVLLSAGVMCGCWKQFKVLLSAGVKCGCWNSLRCCLVQVLNVAVERMLLISSCYEY
jgi:hypothetical protein